MELEELTKTQIILLVLLVSFVTSIATGIVTVSLLAQAPPAVTQTVNHIIERTVTAALPTDSQAAAAVTHETTVVVKEDDLVTKSVSDAFTRVGRIHADTSTSSPIIALGAVTASGLLITDSGIVDDVTHAVTFGDATFFYQLKDIVPSLSVAIMAATGTTPNLAPFKIASRDSVKLGQSLIALSGLKESRIDMTIESGTTAHGLETSLTGAPAGAPIITISGDLVGISTAASRDFDKGAFIFMSEIATASTTPLH